MIIVDAIVETVAASGFTAWPVAKPPVGSVLSLSGRLSAAEVGTVMAAIADSSVPATDEDAVGPDGPELIRRMIDAECADALQLPRPQELLTVLDRHFHITETR